MLIAFDVETTGNQWRRTFQARRARLIGYSVCWEPGRAYYVQTDNLDAIKHWLEDPDVPVVCHNLKYEIIVCATHGVTLRNGHDTKLMANLLRRPSTHLKDLTWSEFGIEQTRFDEVDWNDLEQVTQYGAADSDYTLRLARRFEPQLAEWGLEDLYELERSLVPVVARMEMTGVAIDREPLDSLRDDLVARMRELQKELYEIYPYQINWNSGPQKARALYGEPGNIRVRPGATRQRRVTYAEHPKERRRCDASGKPIQYRVTHRQDVVFELPGLGLPVLSTTDSGDPATDIATLRLLAEWAADNDNTVASRIVELLIERTSIVKCLSNHVTRLPLLVQEDGRVHGSFNQAGAYEEAAATSGEAPETGRFSSSGPNFQNITSHGDESRPYIVEWAHRIRRGIVARPGWTIIKADFSKQEPRIAAFLSGDERFIHDVTDGDFYKTFASIAFKKPVEAINKEERQIGKRSGMAWLNQSGPKGIKKSAYWMSDAEAQNELIKPANDWYATLYAWFREQKAFMRKHGYVRTYYNRIVDFPEAFSGDNFAISAAERACIPGIIQGTGADVMKVALLRLARAFEDLGLRVEILMTVHDEVVIECPDEELDEVLSLCIAMSADIIPFDLPVEVNYGPNWADQELIWE